jgi:mannitol/fructose-specific phosphotransferase system IIA component (Ntr-type)
MSTLASSLRAKDINLSLRASGHRDAVEEILAALRGDERVKDWEKLRTTLASSIPDNSLGETPSATFLHHCRSESVSDLVIAAGRSEAGIVIPGQETKVRLVFVAAIPGALNNEYLRILGAMSRVSMESSSMSELIDAPDAPSFIEILEKGCRQ